MIEEGAINKRPLLEVQHLLFFDVDLALRRQVGSRKEAFSVKRRFETAVNYHLAPS